MTANTSVFIGGCGGSSPGFSDDRLIWNPEDGSIDKKPFSRQKYGGRTTCYFICHEKTCIVVDNGFGIEPVSDLILQMFPQGTDVWFVQTHYHMDHIHGMPFNKLLYHQGMILRYYSPDLSEFRSPTKTDVDKRFMEHMINMYFDPSGTYFFVPIQALGSKREHIIFRLGTTLQIGDIQVKTISLNHPGGCCGYRFEVPGSGPVVIATDYEPAPEPDPTVVEFFEGARLLLVDMQYRDDEYTGERAIGKLAMPRVGWGHGTPHRLIPTILGCNQLPWKVRVVHHDPAKSDDELDAFEADSENVLMELSNNRPSIDYGFAHGQDMYIV